MNKPILFFFLAIFSVQSNSMNAQSFGIMTYNIRLDVKSDGVNQWKNRREGVVSLIKNHKPDIFGIQEGLPHQVEYLSNHLKDYTMIGEGRDGGNNSAGVTSDDKKSRKQIKRIDEQNFYEPIIPQEYLNDSETLFLEWTREALPQNNRFSRLVLKNSDGEVIYNAEYNNVGYVEMLRPVTTDFTFNKEDAKKKLMELKEYLDMGIITQEEFNNKAVSLKKILLGN
tara:strand:+ start:1622 stop:2299 length:678 start_codon:yes stop_codon:yes gene_type:complete